MASNLRWRGCCPLVQARMQRAQCCNGWYSDLDRCGRFDFVRRTLYARLLEQMDLSSVYAVLAAHEALEAAGLLDQPTYSARREFSLDAAAAD